MEELLKLLKASQWDEVASLWLDCLQKGITREHFRVFPEIIHKLWQAGQKELALELLKHTTTTCAKLDDTYLWVQALRLAVEYNHAQKNLLAEFCTAFKKLYADIPYLAIWIDKVAEQNHPPVKFMQILDKLVMFREGSIVKHKSGWGIGKVTGISQEKMELAVDLEKRPNHKIDILAAADCLIPIDNDSFEALLAFDTESLKQQACHEPLKLIYKLLQFNGGPTSAHELKQYLYPKVISAQEWSKWWSKCRKLIMSDPYIEVAGEGHSKFMLREKPVAWEDEALVHFEKTNILELPIYVQEYLKNSTEKKHLPHFAKILSKACSEHLQKQKPWYALEGYFIFQECLAVNQDIRSVNIPTLEEIVGNNAISIFSHVRIPGLALRFLDVLLTYEPKWEEHLEGIFKKGTDLARDTICKYLTRHSLLDKNISKIAQTIMNNILGFPDAFLWFAKQVINERLAIKEMMPNLFELFNFLVQTVATLKSLRQTDSAKQLLRLFSSSLANKIGLAVDQSQAQKISHIVDDSPWLPAAFRETLLAHIREQYPNLFRIEKPIYTTDAGLAKYEEELKDILQNKIPENEKAIGYALSLGDLSENAELNAAREMEFELKQKAQQMRNNIARAAVIDFDKVSTETVGVGTKVTLLGSNGEEVYYTILGPWDVNIPLKVVSFLTPVAEAVLGKRRGDVVKLPTGVEYRVQEISKYQGDK